MDISITAPLAPSTNQQQMTNGDMASHDHRNGGDQGASSSCRKRHKHKKHKHREHKHREHKHGECKHRKREKGSSSSNGDEKQDKSRAHKTQPPQTDNPSKVENHKDVQFHCAIPSTESRSPSTSTTTGSSVCVSKPPLLSPQIPPPTNTAPPVRTLTDTQDSTSQMISPDVMPILRRMVEVEKAKKNKKKQCPKRERLMNCSSTRRMVKCRYCTRVFRLWKNRNTHEHTVHKEQLKHSLTLKKISKKVKKAVKKKKAVESGISRMSRRTCAAKSDGENSPPSTPTKEYICPVCRKPEDEFSRKWIECETCGEWIHFSCEGITRSPGRNESWSCSLCKRKEAVDPKPGPSRINSHNSNKPKSTIVRETKPKSCAACEYYGLPDSMIDCDSCVATFHLGCIGFKRFPPSDKIWNCDRCKTVEQSEENQECDSQTVLPKSRVRSRYWSGSGSTPRSIEDKTEGKKNHPVQKTKNKSGPPLNSSPWRYTKTKTVIEGMGGGGTEGGPGRRTGPHPNLKNIKRPVKTVVSTRYSCNICSKSFTTLSNLKDHQTIHSGAKSHTCPFCPQTFRWRYSISPHIKIVHPELEIKSYADYERLRKKGYYQ